jgi:DNA-binding SARP family transcriptional activator
MVAHETLADTFWPDIEADTVSHRLHLAVSGARGALRHATGAFNPIRCVSGAYGWHPLITVQSDAMRFDECYNSSSPASALEGVNLYVGEFLAGEDKDWILPIRLRYASAYVAMLECLAAEAARRGDHESALRHALQLVETDRSHEGAARLAMRCLGRLGRRTLALAQYEQLRGYLKIHLGVKPTAETDRLRSSILKGDPD